MPASTSVDKLKVLEDLGVTHVAIVTMNEELPNPESHVDAIKRARDTLASQF